MFTEEIKNQSSEKISTYLLCFFGLVLWTLLARTGPVVSRCGQKNTSYYLTDFSTDPFMYYLYLNK